MKTFKLFNITFTLAGGIGTRGKKSSWYYKAPHPAVMVTFVDDDDIENVILGRLTGLYAIIFDKSLDYKYVSKNLNNINNKNKNSRIVRISIINIIPYGMSDAKDHKEFCNKSKKGKFSRNRKYRINPRNIKNISFIKDEETLISKAKSITLF